MNRKAKKDLARRKTFTQLHYKKRLEERYDVTLGRADIRTLISRKKVLLNLNNSSRRQLCKAILGVVPYYFIYDVKMKMIVTFLTKEMADKKIDDYFEDPEDKVFLNGGKIIFRFNQQHYLKHITYYGKEFYYTQYGNSFFSKITKQEAIEMLTPYQLENSPIEDKKGAIGVNVNILKYKRHITSVNNNLSLYASTFDNVEYYFLYSRKLKGIDVFLTEREAEIIKLETKLKKLQELDRSEQDMNQQEENEYEERY